MRLAEAEGEGNVHEIDTLRVEAVGLHCRRFLAFGQLASPLIGLASNIDSLGWCDRMQKSSGSQHHNIFPRQANCMN